MERDAGVIFLRYFKRTRGWGKREKVQLDFFAAKLPFRTMFYCSNIQYTTVHNAAIEDVNFDVIVFPSPPRRT